MSGFDALSLQVPKHAVRTMPVAKARPTEVEQLHNDLISHSAVQHAWFTRDDELFVKSDKLFSINFQHDPFICLVQSEHQGVAAVRVWV